MALCAAVRELSRRDLLKEGGAGAAALALAGAWLPAAAPAAAGGLTRRRQATYRALVRALQGEPAAGLRHRDAASATREFAAWYEGQEASIRGHAEAILDQLDGLGLVGGSPRRDLASLRACGEAGGGSPSAEQATGCAVVAAARSLAGAAA